MSKYVWVCRGCLCRFGADIETVTRSCVGNAKRIECAACKKEYDDSWLVHMLFESLTKALQEVLRTNLNKK